MLVLRFPVPDSKATDNRIFALEALVPDVPLKCVPLYEMQIDGVDGKLGRGPDNGVHLVVFEEEGDDGFADAAVGPHHNDVLLLLHLLTGNKIFYSNRYTITSFYFSTSPPSPPSKSDTLGAPHLTDAPLSSSGAELCQFQPESVFRDLCW